MFELVIAILIVLVAAWAGYERGIRAGNAEARKVIEGTIQYLVDNHFAIETQDSNEEHGELEKIHPKYFEMVKLWEETRAKEEREIDLAYED